MDWVGWKVRFDLVFLADVNVRVVSVSRTVTNSLPNEENGCGNEKRMEWNRIEWNGMEYRCVRAQTLFLFVSSNFNRRCG